MDLNPVGSGPGASGVRDDVLTADLVRLAAEVGGEDAGPISPRGSRSRAGEPRHREVRAGAGVIEFHPEEMVLRCGAGTRLDELHAEVARAGQELALPTTGTAAGALATGHSDILRRGRGPIRDTVLEIRWIDAWGRVVRSGGPTVKNVSGFDLCRLLVGSRGTLGVMGEVTLRTRPAPASREWFSTTRDPEMVDAELYRPTAVLWDGERSWVALEGHPRDVDDEARRVGLVAEAGPPELPDAERWSIPPARWREVTGPGRFVVEIGVGVVHHERCADPDGDPLPTPPTSRLVELNRRVREALDPRRRFEPEIEMIP